MFKDEASKYKVAIINTVNERCDGLTISPDRVRVVDEATAGDEKNLAGHFTQQFQQIYPSEADLFPESESRWSADEIQASVNLQAKLSVILQQSAVDVVELGREAQQCVVKYLDLEKLLSTLRRGFRLDVLLDSTQEISAFNKRCRDLFDNDASVRKDRRRFEQRRAELKAIRSVFPLNT